jgi:hypothetical protein
VNCEQRRRGARGPVPAPSQDMDASIRAGREERGRDSVNGAGMCHRHAPAPLIAD